MDQPAVAAAPATEDQADRAFFARLGLAFAASIIISGVMMVAVGPVPQDTDRPYLAAVDK